MTLLEKKCSWCKCLFEIYIGHYNRAMQMGNKVYCSRKCAGLGRRSGKTDEQKKKEKSEYDKGYHLKNPDKKRMKAAEYFKKDYADHPEKYKKRRQALYSRHLEYLNTEKYKKWKGDYDKKYLAKKYFGIYWQSALLLSELEEFLIKNRPDGIKFQMGITNKTQKRKRLWQKQTRQKSYLQRT